MLRKGRFDELFFVDLPNQAEREAIWEIQIGKHGRAPGDFDLVQLAKATEGLTGSEIENVFIEALYLAFDQDKEPTDLDKLAAPLRFSPCANDSGSTPVWVWRCCRSGLHRWPCSGRVFGIDGHGTRSELYNLASS